VEAHGVRCGSQIKFEICSERMDAITIALNANHRKIQQSHVKFVI
jgi:hypothetical protein